MTTPDSDQKNAKYKTRLYPEDQARVDEFVNTGIHSVKRKPFRPGRLLIVLIVVVLGLSMFSQFLARSLGV